MRTQLPLRLAMIVSGFGALASAAPPAVDALPVAATPFELQQVQLTGGPFLHSQDLNIRYLLSLDTDRLLAWFRKEAGLQPKAKVYGGWESDSIAGHSLGHYLSACAMGYATTSDERLKQRVDEIVAELAACQTSHGDGYVAAIPNGKALFADVSRGEIRSSGFDLNGAWAPWYNVHKLMAGLVCAHRYGGNQQALKVVSGLADWVHATTAHLSPEQLAQMLACEHGGMSEAMADVYSLTRDPRHLDVATRVFYHHAVLDPLSQGVDCLPGLHANTQIPKVIGMARIAEITGDRAGLETAAFFWDRVVSHHTYVNGGNSSHEYFGPPGELSRRLGETTEACNTYNMLRLTRILFAHNPLAKYADYYERALWNHILAHQHPETGMLMYKGFLDPGARKGFCSPFDSFWCCVGSGMENHVKHNDSVYFHDGDGLWINLFVPSKLNWKEHNLTLTQETTLPFDEEVTLRIDVPTPTELEIRIRRPAWAMQSMDVVVNDQPMATDAPPGTYVSVNRRWEAGDRITLALPHALRVEPTPDDPQMIAFLDGPILLCADLGDDKATPLLIADENQAVSLFEPDATQPMNYEARDAGRVVDVTPEQLDRFGARQSVRLVPHFSIIDTNYSVYLNSMTADEWESDSTTYRRRVAELSALKARTVDVLRIGEMQPERDHGLTGEKSGVGEFRAKKYRQASDGGSFTFKMDVDPESPLALMCTYWGDETGQRTFDISIDGEKIATQTLNRNAPGRFFDVLYSIPVSLVHGKSTVQVSFQAHPGNIAGGVFESCRILRTPESTSVDDSTSDDKDRQDAP